MQRELHGIYLGRETLRQWMMVAGLWKDRRARLKPVHQPRYRRDSLGELVQIDGSEHWWFEGRGPQCTLLVYIDDATSRLMHLQFVESESTFDYFAATRAYLERYGKPVAFYSDKHGVFRVNRKDAASGDGMTQFGRALHALNIDIICANSSQAKGRVERAHSTLQDRLVKEMRLCGIDAIAAGNAFLHLEQHKISETREVRELALFCLSIAVVVETAAVEPHSYKVPERVLKIGGPTMAFVSHAQSTRGFEHRLTTAYH